MKEYLTETTEGKRDLFRLRVPAAEAEAEQWGDRGQPVPLAIRAQVSLLSSLRPGTRQRAGNVAGARLYSPKACHSADTSSS